MTDQNQDARRAAGDIRRYLDAQRKARTAAVPRPEILDESEPPDGSRRAGWRALREQAEEQYVSALLGKAVLTPEEQSFLAGRIAQHYKGE